jgi:branched-subunit amino acid ABC-type transport system permease component
MGHLLNYIIPGISDGAIYALCALGLVLTYKTSGVFNFAHGGVAAAAAYLFYDFRDRQHLPWPLAAAIALVIVGLVGGLVLERMAHWLAETPVVMRVVATVGLLVFLQSILTAKYGPSNIEFAQFLPTGGFHIGQVTVSGGQMITVALALGATVGMYLFFKKARLGVAMQGVVNDPNLLSLQGTSPTVVRRYAWIVGASFAGISGMLLAPQVGVSVNVLVLLIISAYGAAAIGMFNSLPLTLLGGIIVGIGVNVLPYYIQHIHTHAVQQGLPPNLPFLVLFGALLLVPRHKFKELGSQKIRRFRPPRQFSRKAVATAVAAALLLGVLIPVIGGRANVNQYSAALGYAVIFMSLALLLWTSGQISLCQLAFAALGASTAGHALQAGFPWPLALLVGGLIAVPAGAIVAIPAIRLPGIFLAIATFGFGILLQNFVFNTYLMFGVAVLVKVPRPHIIGLNLTGDRAYYYLALLVAALCAAVVVLVRRSRLGRILRGLADSPVALNSHGANTNMTRVYVFCISAFLAGVGGALLAGVSQAASGSPGGTYDYTISLIAVAVLGFCGRRLLFSPFLAAFLYEVVKIYPGFNNPTVIKYQGAIFGIVAMVVALAPGFGSIRVPRRSQERADRSPVTSRSDEAVTGVAAVAAAVAAPGVVPARVMPRQPIGVSPGD